MFEYLVVPCKGEMAIAQACNDKSKEGFEPFLITYAGEEIVPPRMESADPTLITKYVMLMRRNVSRTASRS